MKIITFVVALFLSDLTNGTLSAQGEKRRYGYTSAEIRSEIKRHSYHAHDCAIRSMLFSDTGIITSELHKDNPKLVAMLADYIEVSWTDEMVRDIIFRGYDKESYLQKWNKLGDAPLGVDATKFFERIDQDWRSHEHPITTYKSKPEGESLGSVLSKVVYHNSEDTMEDGLYAMAFSRKQKIGHILNFYLFTNNKKRYFGFIDNQIGQRSSIDTVFVEKVWVMKSKNLSLKSEFTPTEDLKTANVILKVEHKGGKKVGSTVSALVLTNLEIRNIPGRPSQSLLKTHKASVFKNFDLICR